MKQKLLINIITFGVITLVSGSNSSHVKRQPPPDTTEWEKQTFSSTKIQLKNKPVVINLFKKNISTDRWILLRYIQKSLKKKQTYVKIGKKHVENLVCNN